MKPWRALLTTASGLGLTMNDGNKEVLTTVYMQRILRGYGVGSFVICIPFALAFLISLFFVIGIELSFVTFFFATLMLFFGAVSVYLLVYCVSMFAASFHRPIVVIATRVNSGSEKTSMWCRFMHRRRTGNVYIHFHGYGSHPSLPVMLESTSAGDKFYLLLDRPGHIISYYPYNDYEYEGEMTPNKYEK